MSGNYNGYGSDTSVAGLGFTIAELNAAALSIGQEPVLEIPETVEEQQFDSAEVAALAEADMNFLAGLCIPLIFKYLFPELFIQLWAWITNAAKQVRTFPQLALGLPRGFAKTTVVKLFIVYCILFTNKKFILVISSTSTLAENIISDVADILDEPNIQAVFGSWRVQMEKDTNPLKKFFYRGRPIIIAGLGAETSLRGMNIKNERPDIMIFEDIQTRECADSEVQSQKLEQWMYGTAMKAKSPHGCMFLFIGNMYPTKHSILRKLKSNPRWLKFITGGILSDGSSLWEELQPIEQLNQEFQNDLESGHPEIFYSEVLNDENALMNTNVDMSTIPYCEFDDDEIPIGKFIVIDPSNDKANSDNVAIGYFEQFSSAVVLKEVDEGKKSPLDTIRAALRMGFKHDCRIIFAEANAYQYSLLFWFNHICKESGIEGFKIEPVYPGRLSKTTRILNMFKELSSGTVQLANSVRSLVFSYIGVWRAIRTDNQDNVLDLITYAPKIVAEFAMLISAFNVLTLEDAQEVSIPDDSERSTF